MFCTKCGTNLNEDAKFYKECGAKTEDENAAPLEAAPAVEEPKKEIELCDKCGAKLAEGSDFCGGCGAVEEAPEDTSDSKALPPGSSEFAGTPLGYIGDDGQWYVTVPYNYSYEDIVELGCIAFFTVTPDRRYVPVCIEDKSVCPGSVVAYPLPPPVPENKLKRSFKVIMPELTPEEDHDGWEVYTGEDEKTMTIAAPVGVKPGEEFWVEIEKEGCCARCCSDENAAKCGWACGICLFGSLVVAKWTLWIIR